MRMGEKGFAARSAKIKKYAQQRGCFRNNYECVWERKKEKQKEKMDERMKEWKSERTKE